jgi:hypothetical protein
MDKFLIKNIKFIKFTGANSIGNASNYNFEFNGKAYRITVGRKSSLPTSLFLSPNISTFIEKAANDIFRQSGVRVKSRTDTISGIGASLLSLSKIIQKQQKKGVLKK